MTNLPRTETYRSYRSGYVSRRKNAGLIWVRFRRVILAPFLVILALSLAAFAQSAAKKAFDKGNALYKQNDAASLNQAILKFDEAYRLYGRNQTRNRGMMALSRVFKGRAFKNLGKFSDASESYREALTLYRRAGDRIGEAAAYSNLGTLFRDQNEPAKAIPYFRDAVTIMAAQKNSSGKARAYSGLADSYLLTKDLKNALPNYLKSIATWKGLKNNDDKIRAYYGVAHVYFANGDGANSIKYGNEAFRLAKQRNRPGIMVEVLDSLARVYDDAGQKKLAVDYRLDALDIYNKARGRVPEDGWDGVVNNLADIYYRMGKLDLAYRMLQKNIRPGVTGDQFKNQTYMVGTLGEVLSAQGKYKEAIGVLNRAIELARQANDKHSEAYNYATLGIAHLGTYWSDSQAFAKAKTAFEKSLSLVKAGTDPSVEATVYEGLIFLYAFTGQQALTIQKIKEAEARNLHTGNSVSAIRVLRAIGAANSFFGNHAKAIQYFEGAYEIAQKRKNVIEGVSLLNRLGYSHFSTGNYAKAIEEFQLSSKHYESFGDLTSSANSLMQLGWVHLRNNNPDQALSIAEKAVDLAAKSEEVRFRMYIGSNALHIAGKSHFAKREYRDALNAFSEALKLEENMNNKPGQKHFLMDISEAYKAMGEKKQAKKFRKKAEKIR